MASRVDGRAPDALRTPVIDVGFHRVAEGSVLYRAGGTVVLCTASLDAKVPPFLEGKGRGWVTAEYQMHPRANPVREGREGRGSKSVSGRTHEIQRLIGRALRAAVDLDRLGERQIGVDCDVLEADGGTRTAAINGAMVALHDAFVTLSNRGQLARGPLRDTVAAISVGIVAGVPCLDLAYLEDSTAEVDMNVVMTGSGRFVEVQGAGEGVTFAEADLRAMLRLARLGIRRVVTVHNRLMGGSGLLPAATAGAPKSR